MLVAIKEVKFFCIDFETTPNPKSPILSVPLKSLKPSGARKIISPPTSCIVSPSSSHVHLLDKSLSNSLCWSSCLLFFPRFLPFRFSLLSSFFPFYFPSFFLHLFFLSLLFFVFPISSCFFPFYNSLCGSFFFYSFLTITT